MQGKLTDRIRPRRSVLYMPGSNARAMEKARTLAADALILDLEDAVAPDAKEIARIQVCEAAKSRAFGAREVIIRINALGTPWGEADLPAVLDAKPDAILVPKVSRAADLQSIDAVAGGMMLWAMIETPRAILDIGEIAGTTGNLACLVMGTNDLLKDMRGKPLRSRENLTAALSLCVLAARAHNLAAIDGVFNNIADPEGFQAECLRARAFGFDGKSLVHPSQIAPCNEIFAPSAEEVELARRIIAAFDLPENSGKGAIALDGKMVERLHAEAAQRTLALADAIAARGAQP
jgi:citrate lyase subunit beta / citryl-CoA lyase